MIHMGDDFSRKSYSEMFGDLDSMIEKDPSLREKFVQLRKTHNIRKSIELLKKEAA